MDWLRNIVIFTTLLGFLQWITPNGPMETYVKYIYSLLTLAVILSPLYSETEITAALKLPVGAVAAVDGYEDAAEQVNQIQSYQIRDIIGERITKEVREVLKDDFPDISEEDIEVYIQQESLKQGHPAPCVITIRTADRENRELITSKLSERFELPVSCIRITNKENGDE